MDLIQDACPPTGTPKLEADVSLVPGGAELQITVFEV